MRDEGRSAWEEKLSGQTVLKFSVSDNGIGIAADVLPTLFDACDRPDGNLTRNQQGTCLSLAICGQMVELMGGEFGLKAHRDWEARFISQL